MNYIKGDTKIPSYLPFPKYLLDMKLPQTAQILYALLLDRAMLSRQNEWQDEQGHVYIIYPIDKMAEALGKGTTSIKDALKALEECGLVSRQRQGLSKPNRIYVLISEDKRESVHQGVGNPTVTEVEKRPSEGQEPVLLLGGNPSTNNLIHNNLTQNNLRDVIPAARAYGCHKNVYLSDDDIQSLERDFPSLWKDYVERLSRYMASKGKTYKYHAATIRQWIQRDKEGQHHEQFATSQHVESDSHAATAQGTATKQKWNIQSVSLD